MLAQRTLTPELMDAPDLERQAHWQALDGLACINRWSRSASLIWPALASLASEKQAPLRVLDIATGGGDVPLALADRARREQLAIQFDVCDISADALDLAQRRAHEAGHSLHCFPFDVIARGIPSGYDAVISSLFLHHLDDDHAIDLLGHMAQATGDLVMINDLRRCRTGWWLAYLGTRLLSRSSIVHVDGPRSVERAFTLGEVRKLADAAGLIDATVAPRWPCRWLLTWRKPKGWTSNAA